jgi:solute carrier family 25 S-adenosylmethionine transporter 26
MTSPCASSQATGAPLSAGDIAKCAAVSSLLAKSSLHPIDTIKCRLQTSSGTGLRSFIREWEGRWTLRLLYSGLSVKMIAYAPAQSLYMTSYSVSKRELQSRGCNERVAVVAGAVAASTAASCIRVPMEAAKIRLQSCRYDNLSHALTCMRADSIRPLVRLFVPQVLVHDMPYSAVQWLCYEYVKPRLRPLIERRQQQRRGSISASDEVKAAGAGGLLSGVIAGCFAGFVTTPLDVVKTTTVVASATDTTVRAQAIARNIYAKHGSAGFFRGASARVVWISANVGVFLGIFEALKSSVASTRRASRAGAGVACQQA